MLPGVQIIEHRVFNDRRGSFSESWKNSNDYMQGSYRQLNTAHSVHNVLRGMHRQDQTKFVIPVTGKIFDVALNPETGEWVGVYLDSTVGLLIPPQYAHGYWVESETAIVQYIVDSPYNKELEENFKWDAYNIEWPCVNTPILSDKDA